MAAGVLSGSNDCTLSFTTIELNLKYFPGLELFVNVSLIRGSKVVASRSLEDKRSDSLMSLVGTHIGH